jgi:hypothetical protein
LFNETNATHPLLHHVLVPGRCTRRGLTDPHPQGRSQIYTMPDRHCVASDIFRGRFFRAWQHIQNEYYMTHKNKSAYKRAGAWWQQQLITTIWELGFQLRAVRNGQVHHTARLETRPQAQRREVERQLTEIYNSRGFMDRKAQVLLETNQEIHVQRPMHVNKSWLAMAGPVIRRSVRRMKKASLRGVRSLRSYFPRRGGG